MVAGTDEGNREEKAASRPASSSAIDSTDLTDERDEEDGPTASKCPTRTTTETGARERGLVASAPSEIASAGRERATPAAGEAVPPPMPAGNGNASGACVSSSPMGREARLDGEEGRGSGEETSSQAWRWAARRTSPPSTFKGDGGT